MLESYRHSLNRQSFINKGYKRINKKKEQDVSHNISILLLSEPKNFWYLDFRMFVKCSG